MVNAQLITAPVAADTSVSDDPCVFKLLNIATSNNAVFANTRALQLLPAAQHGAIRPAARRAAARGWTLAEEAQATALCRMRERGMQVPESSAEVGPALREPSLGMAGEWVARAGEDGQRLLAAYCAQS